MIPKAVHLRTRVHTVQEGWDLILAIMRKGYEGVQNDSSRYNDSTFYYCMKDQRCWVGVWGHSLHISNTHDKDGRMTLKEVGKCKFIEELGLNVTKTDLPKSLRRYAKEERIRV